MTRSVEIPSEVVLAATVKWYEATPGVSWDDAGKYERAAMLSRTKLLLEAALPYLAPTGDGGEAARNAAYQEAASDIRREIDLRADLEAEGPEMPPEYWQAFKTCMDIASEVGGLT